MKNLDLGIELIVRSNCSRGTCFLEIKVIYQGYITTSKLKKYSIVSYVDLEYGIWKKLSPPSALEVLEKCCFLIITTDPESHCDRGALKNCSIPGSMIPLQRLSDIIDKVPHSYVYESEFIEFKKYLRYLVEKRNEDNISI